MKFNKPPFGVQQYLQQERKLFVMSNNSTVLQIREEIIQFLPFPNPYHQLKHTRGYIVWETSTNWCHPTTNTRECLSNEQFSNFIHVDTAEYPLWPALVNDIQAFSCYQKVVQENRHYQSHCALQLFYRQSKQSFHIHFIHPSKLLTLRA